MGQTETRVVSLLEGHAAGCASYAFSIMGITPLTAGLPTPQGAEASIAYVAHVAATADILLLPLGLYGAGSLHIAREIHRTRPPLWTILYTASRTATSRTTTPLFDYCLSDRRRLDLRATLETAATAPPSKRLSPEAVEAQIAILIEQEHCFRTLRQGPLRLMSVDDLLARDRRYLDRQAYLSRVRGQGIAHPPLSS